MTITNPYLVLNNSKRLPAPLLCVSLGLLLHLLGTLLLALSFLDGQPVLGPIPKTHSNEFHITKHQKKKTINIKKT